MTYKQRKWIQSWYHWISGWRSPIRNGTWPSRQDCNGRNRPGNTRYSNTREDTCTHKDKRSWPLETSEYNGRLGVYKQVTMMQRDLSITDSHILSFISLRGIRRHHNVQTVRLPESSSASIRTRTCTTLAWYSTNRILSPPMKKYNELDIRHVLLWWSFNEFSPGPETTVTTV